MTNYAQCRNCGTIHFITKDSNKVDFSINGFRERNSKHCSCCGSKNFKKISKYYAKAYFDGNKIQPVILEKEE